MRILYVARHGQANSNDDEGAIAYALKQLGHEVVKVQEFKDEVPVEWMTTDWPKMDQVFDFCLFHKWSDFRFMKRMKCPLVMWFFDLVDWPQDHTLAKRCEARKRWMAEVVPLVDLGFCTDGDWVERFNNEWYTPIEHVGQVHDNKKLHVLRQGADERVVGFGKEQERNIDVLFVGGVKGCGVQRESFVRELRKRYGSRFNWVERGVYREALRDLVARSKVVVCPDSPVTDRYWSNRVYVMAGFGACLLHPYCFELKGLPSAVYYRDREHMFRLIDEMIPLSKLTRQDLSLGVLDEVKSNHLYRHRCEELVRVVKEKLGI